MCACNGIQNERHTSHANYDGLNSSFMLGLPTRNGYIYLRNEFKGVARHFVALCQPKLSEIV